MPEQYAPHLDGVLDVDEPHHVERLGHLDRPLADGVERGGGDGLRGKAARAVAAVHASLCSRSSSSSSSSRECELRSLMHCFGGDSSVQLSWRTRCGQGSLPGACRAPVAH